MEKSNRALTGFSALGHVSCLELFSSDGFPCRNTPSVGVVDLWLLFYCCNTFQYFSDLDFLYISTKLNEHFKNIFCVLGTGLGVGYKGYKNEELTS